MRYLSFATSLALLTAIGCQRAADQKPAPAAAPPVKTVPVAAKPLAEQFADFKREHHEREQKFYSQLSADRNDNEKINQANKDWQQFAMQHAAKLKALIKTNAGDPAAFDGLLVLVGELRYPLDEDLIKLVNEKFLAEPRMGQLCFDLRQRGSEQWPEAILQAATKHSLREVRGQAEFALGDYYRSKALPYGRPLPEAEQDKWLAEAAKHYTIALTDYSSATTPDGKDKLGDKAGPELARIKNIPLLKVGKVAPDIEAEDIDGVKFKLSDYRGKVVMLDFWGHW